MPPKEWLLTMGVDARVFLIDTGFESQPDVEPYEYRSFTGDKSDPSRHGSLMARLIACRDERQLGWAPLCRLYIAKAIGGARCRHILEAMEWAIEGGAQVVSMSFAYDVEYPPIAKAIEKLHEMNAICLAAKAAGLRYPHGHAHVVPVCGLDDPGPGLKTTNRAARRPGDGPGTEWRGPSVSTAIMAGVAACAKAYDPSITAEAFRRRLGSNYAK